MLQGRLQLFDLPSEGNSLILCDARMTLDRPRVWCARSRELTNSLPFPMVLFDLPRLRLTDHNCFLQLQTEGGKLH